MALCFQLSFLFCMLYLPTSFSSSQNVFVSVLGRFLKVILRCAKKATYITEATQKSTVENRTGLSRKFYIHTVIGNIVLESFMTLYYSRARKNASRVYQRSVLTSSDPIVVALRENSRTKLFQVKTLEKVCVATTIM